MSSVHGYVICPRCKGDRQIFAYTRLPGIGQPAQGEYFTCPPCSGTGTMDEEDAAQWRADNTDEADEC